MARHEQRAAAAAAKPAARKTEAAPHDPMFRRLDEAFARITVEMHRSEAEQHGEDAAAEPTRESKDEAEVRRQADQADAERRAQADRHAEAQRQAEERWQAAERQAEARRQAEEERQAEAERQAAVRRQAAERQAEAKREAEAKRQAEAERKAEARRRAAELHAEARRQSEAERLANAERQVEEERIQGRHPAPLGQDDRDDGREEPRFDSADSMEDVAGNEDGWAPPEAKRLYVEPRMGGSDPRLADAWREGRPGFPALNQGRQRKPWGRRASLALVGMLAVLAVLLAPYTGPWISRLSPPSALNSNMAEIRDFPAPASDPTNEWETASGDPEADETGDADSSSPSSGRVAATDSSGNLADPASKADRPTDRAGGQQGREALTPPPKSPPAPPKVAARSAPSAPEKRAAVSDSARSGRNVERAAPRREPVEVPLTEDFATAVRKALSEHRGQSPVLGALEASGITAAGEIVTLVQQRLRERGYDPGIADGRAGPRTRAAIRKFQRDNNHEEDGDISVALLQSLGILGQQIHAFGGEVTPTRSP